MNKYLCKVFYCKTNLIDKFSVEAVNEVEATAKANERVRNKTYAHNIVKALTEIELTFLKHLN